MVASHLKFFEVWVGTKSSIVYRFRAL